MSGLSRRFRAFVVLVGFFGSLGFSMAPPLNDPVDGAPIAVGALAPDAIDRERLVIGSSRDSEPVRLVWPGDGLRTGWWGEVRSGHLHEGIDLDGETGDVVWAAGRGRVTWSGPAPAGYAGYGTVIEIDHGQGVTTLYAHLSRADVVTGDFVQSGQVIGAMGTSGSVTGSHLHFEVRVGGSPVDPEDWLPPRPNRPAIDQPDERVVNIF